MIMWLSIACIALLIVCIALLVESFIYRHVRFCMETRPRPKYRIRKMADSTYVPEERVGWTWYGLDQSYFECHKWRRNHQYYGCCRVDSVGRAMKVLAAAGCGASEDVEVVE